MYLAVCIALSALFIYLFVSHFFITDAKWAKVNKIVSVALGASGLLGSIVTVIVFYSRISSLEKEGLPGDWASDVFSGFLKDVLPPFALIFAVLILSAVFLPKRLLLRAPLCSMTSIVILIFGYITSFLAVNKNFSIVPYIRLMSVFLSLLCAVCGYFDFKRKEKELTAASEEAKNK